MFLSKPAIFSTFIKLVINYFAKKIKQSLILNLMTVKSYVHIVRQKSKNQK